MEYKLSTKSLDAFRGVVGAKNEHSQRAPPASMINMVLEIGGDEDRRGPDFLQCL